MAATSEMEISARSLEGFRQNLLSARRKLLAECGTTEHDLSTFEDARESELEERSQVEAAADVLSRLMRRRIDELESIEAALQRIADGRYGACTRCGSRIALGRLRAVPYAALCGTCAVARDAGAPTSEGEEELPSLKPVVPSALAVLDDAEIAELVAERFRAEVGDALDAVRAVCRHGVVTLAGEIACEELHQVALRIVEEELDLEVVDRMRVSGFGERRVDVDRLPLQDDADAILDAALMGNESTEDIFEAEEEGYEYHAPVRPFPLTR
jgi:RNA polymerase-binding protein DksA